MVYKFVMNGEKIMKSIGAQQMEKENRAGIVRMLLLGLLLGIASITPGLSGGVLAIAFGVYAPAIDAIVNIRSHFKRSVAFLFPLAAGGGAGVILFGIIMKPLLDHYAISIIYLFMGLVVGSLPSFLKESTRGGFRTAYLIPLAIAFLAGILINYGMDKSAYNSELNIPTLLASGAVLSFGTVIPGISSSFILLQMGVYDKILTECLHINIGVILWLAIGFLAVSLLTVKLINTAFKRFGGYAHFAALGFLVASVAAVFPGFRAGAFVLIDLFLFAAGAVAVYLFMKKASC